MALEKRTVVKRIEIEFDEATGKATTFVKLLKQVVDGSEVIASEPHRTVIPEGVAAADQLAAVNSHLGLMGYPAVKAADITEIDSYVTKARAKK